MKKVAASLFFFVLLLVSCGKGGELNSAAESAWQFAPPAGVALDTVSIDTMNVKNPFIMYEKSSDYYYMVADGGYMWLSRNLREWSGPYDVLEQDTTLWIGAQPVITSPEIHCHGGKYYYMATFERADVCVATVDGSRPVRRSCVALVADDIRGPYRTIDSKSLLLAPEEVAAHPTFSADGIMGATYMVYSREDEQDGNGTVQIIMFTDDLGRRIGEPYIMFTASQNSWSRAAVNDRKSVAMTDATNGDRGFSPVVEAPCLVMTDTGEMGILFTTRIGDEKVIGAAYSETGAYGYNGPWVIEPQPLMTGNVTIASVFTDFDGTKVMVVGKDTVVDGAEKCIPQLLKLDMQFDKLKIEGYYKF